jgi:hypothetical protein
VAGAAYAELYAQSRRGGNGGRPAAGSRTGPHRRCAFDYSCAAAGFDIFRRITQDITNSSQSESIIDSLFNTEKAVLRRRPLILETRVFPGSPRTFPYQTFPNPADI